jgi:ribosome-associated protein
MKKSAAVAQTTAATTTALVPAAAAAPIPDRERQLLHQLWCALDDKKAEDLRVLDVSGLSSITDYLLLANGNSEPHLRALRIAAERVIDESGVPLAGSDRSQESGWVVIDAYQVMVHLFTAENRQKYRLDLLWRDSREVSPVDLAQSPSPPSLPPAPAKAVRAPRKAAAKPKAKKAAAPRRTRTVSDNGS